MENENPCRVDIVLPPELAGWLRTKAGEANMELPEFIKGLLEVIRILNREGVV